MPLGSLVTVGYIAPRRLPFTFLLITVAIIHCEQVKILLCNLLEAPVQYCS